MEMGRGDDGNILDRVGALEVLRDLWLNRKSGSG